MFFVSLWETAALDLARKTLYITRLTRHLQYKYKDSEMATSSYLILVSTDFYEGSIRGPCVNCKMRETLGCPFQKESWMWKLNSEPVTVIAKSVNLTSLGAEFLAVSSPLQNRKQSFISTFIHRELYCIHLRKKSAVVFLNEQIIYLINSRR